MFLQLASTEIGILQTILDGGLPLALLIAIGVVFKLYQAEKSAKDEEVGKRVTAAEASAVAEGNLRKEYSTKVESLLRERIESETSSQRIIIEATEVMQSVVMQMGTLGDLIEAAERET